MNDSLEKKWYVIRAISGKEKKVKEYLESEIARLGLQSSISQVLIPTEKVFQIRKGKKISKERFFGRQQSRYTGCEFLFIVDRLRGIRKISI